MAERKGWSKFGLSQKDSAGPATDTTSVGENIIFRPSTNWRKDAKEEKTEPGSVKEQLKDKKVKCRICNGEHYTMKCPFKDTMAPAGEDGATADVAAGAGDDGPTGAGGLGTGKSSYVPPHMRNGGSGAGDKMGGGGKFERDDLATLRVTNVRISKFVHLRYENANMLNRFRKWQRSTNFGTCSSVLVASLVYSLQRIGRPVWLRALPSSRTRIDQMPSRLRIRWMVSVSSI